MVDVVVVLDSIVFLTLPKKKQLDPVHILSLERAEVIQEKYGDERLLEGKKLSGKVDTTQNHQKMVTV